PREVATRRWAAGIAAVAASRRSAAARARSVAFSSTAEARSTARAALAASPVSATAGDGATVRLTKHAHIARRVLCRHLDHTGTHRTPTTGENCPNRPTAAFPVTGTRPQRDQLGRS